MKVLPKINVVCPAAGHSLAQISVREPFIGYTGGAVWGISCVATASVTTAGAWF